MAAVSPFHRSGNGFSLPTPQSDTSATPLSHASPALPSSAAPPVASQAEVDTAVGKYLRSIVSQEAAWDTFVERRNAVLPMASQLEQYQYIKGMFSRFTSLRTPPDLKGAPGVIITQAHVLRAFNLPVTWGDECKEVLALTGMYGRAGRRYEDPRVVAMLDEAPPISTGMQVKRYLTLLREIHGRWTVEHPHE
ncbi:hypothetical protein B0H21DRAFT_694673 [Amylocystis lapponica]|nr:hypothetical protein B0H21DRAFT_700144 [Amylocystis lapponica]KAH9944743.1 hypothetical protein B0H21DRAFT_694673 [Amylocystis lapponica]